MAHERGLLVDFENVQQIDLSLLPSDFRVTIFVGCTQKNVPLETVQAVQHLGDRVEWCQIEGSGSNALDFHIAYYLGCRFARTPKAQCVILSKDTGFDPLVRHLKGQGLNCKRINSLTELSVPSCPPVHAPQPSIKAALAKLAPEAVPEPNYALVVARLTNAPKNRPGKRASLTNHVATMFHKKLPEADVAQLVERLFTEGKATETNRTLTYLL